MANATQQQLSILRVLSFLVLVLTLTFSTYYVITEGIAKQREVSPFQEIENCGPCLDLAVANATLADFSFINCPEGLVKYELKNTTTQEIYQVWRTEPPPHPKDTWTIVEDYSSIDAVAFKGRLDQQLQGTGEKVTYLATAVVTVVLLYCCSGCLFLGFTMLINSGQFQQIEGHTRKALWTLVVLIISLFAWLMGVYYLADAEIQQKQSFGQTDCMVIATGYAFYQVFIVTGAIVSGFTWIWLLFNLLKDCQSEPNIIVKISQFLTQLCPCFMLLGTIVSLVALAKVPDDQVESFDAIVALLVTIWVLILCLCYNTAQTYLRPQQAGYQPARDGGMEPISLRNRRFFLVVE